MSLQPAELRRRERQTEARRAILDSARDLLLEVGDEGFTIRKLSERCGYKAPTLYHHFGDKTGLIDAVLDEVFGELVEGLERIPGKGDALATMRAQFHAIVAFGLRNPAHYRLMTRARAADAEPLPTGERARLLIERPLEQLASVGALRVDLEVARQSLWVLLHGLISLPATRPDVEWCEDLAEVALEGMLEGVVATRVRVTPPRKER